MSVEYDFKAYLRDELLKRTKKNPQYSMRAFATSLGVNHAILSLILNGKRKITPRHVTTFGKALGLTSIEIEQYVSGLAAIATNSSRVRKANEMARLTLDTFQLISDWYYDAIMELSRVEGFEGTPHAISKLLGISIAEAHDAIDRLQRMGLIEINPDGTWKEVGHYTTIEDVDFTDTALRAYQKRILDLSNDAVNAVPKPHRDHTSVVAAIRTSDLPEIKLMFKKFRAELLAYTQREGGSSYDDVYAFSFSAFPLTKKFKGVQS